MGDGPAFASLALKKLGSLKFTVVVLSLIALLVVAGTLCQARLGIYAAQQKVFDSWIFWLFGVLPLPGMRLAGVLFLLSLLAALATRFSRRRPPLGLLLIHAGLLLLVGGGFFIAATAQESFLTLAEGESRAFSTASGEWEIALEPLSAGGAEQVVDVADLAPGQAFPFPGPGLEITLETHYPNCRLAPAAAAGAPGLEALPPADDPAENIPGVRLLVRDARGSGRISLFGGEDRPKSFAAGGAALAFSLRPKRFSLPLEIKLIDFDKTMHPGSGIPRSFASQVEISEGGVRRRAVISMNRPLRFREYAFYQSAYGEDAGKGESSTFSVVRSSGRWLPYAASTLLLIGLAGHFLGMLLAGWRGRRREAGP